MPGLSRTTDRSSRRLQSFIAIAVVLGVVSFAASRQRLPDSFFYTNAEARGIIPGCAEIHCFRVLVPWTLRRLPGPSMLKWKAYAVMLNAASALAVFDLSIAFGLSPRAAAIAMALSAFGFGSMLTMFEPYTSDPVMFWMSPLVTRWSLEERFGRAAIAASLGVLSKEFVVAALAIVAGFYASARDWINARRTAAAAAIAFAIWLALHAWLRWAFGYSYGPNRSPRLTQGSYLYIWLSNMSARGALSAMYNEFGPVYLLAPVGWWRAPPALKRLTLVALPVALVFAYVQQPDRALWNFHYLTSPLAALMLESLSNVLLGVFLALYVAANMKVGAQVGFMPQARYAFLITAILAIVAILMNRRASHRAIVRGLE